MSDWHSLEQAGERMQGFTRLGNMYFDVPRISPINETLHQGGSPSGLLPQYAAVVDLYGRPSYRMQDGTDFLRVGMHDAHGEVDGELVDAIAAFVHAKQKTGPVLVLCQAGLNRSSLITARALMLGGMTADEAISLIREKRSPACLCNSDFENHLRSLS